MTYIGDPPPPAAKAYKRTPTFSEATIPAGLLKDHSTKAGVWGMLNVTDGRLRYIVPSRGIDTELDRRTVAVIVPEELHRVEPIGPVAFFVEFLREET